MADFPTVTELVREHAYLRSLCDRWSVGFERLRRLDLPGGDEPDANLPAMAADEIERLRAAGAALYVLLDEMHGCGRRQPGLTEALWGWEAVAATEEGDRG